MGSCLSKPTPVTEEEVTGSGKQSSAPQRTADAAAGADSCSAREDKEQSSVDPPSNVAAWSAADVQKWACSLGFPRASIAALQGVVGVQLLSLTDQRLLQLGVQDAAERHALLAARSSLQQQGTMQACTLQTQLLSGKPSDDKPADALPEAALRVSATGMQTTSEVAGMQTMQQSMGSGISGSRSGQVLGSNRSTDGGAAAEQQSGTPLAGDKSGDLTSMVTRGASFTAAAEVLEEMKDLQVLRITANGRLFRHSRPVPLSLVPYCQALCTLHDLRRGAHYHYDNCHQLLQRCVLVQDYLLALPHRQLQQKTVMLSQLSLLVQDAYDVFSQFSERGWLLRLLNSVRDQDDFNRLDQMLVNALESARVDTSEQPLLDLKKPRSYVPQQQQLEIALKNLGGIAKLLRDPLSATIRLQSLLHHLPSGSNIEALLQQEIDHYLSSQLWFSDTSKQPGSRENSFTRVGSGGSAGSNGLNRGSSGGSGSGLLRRTSSLGARARTNLSIVEPFMVLRNDTVRTEWRQAFGGRERVTWREFWYKLVQPAAHIWGLDQQLDKFTTDYVQQSLQRGAHGLLTISELDFAFPPNTSPAMVIQAKLKEHSNSSSSLPAVNLVPSARPKSTGVLKENWLRMLQEPVPRLHNFPEFPVGFNPRDEEVSELVLGMADVSTNLVMLTGAPGVGRSMLAASLAHDLVVTHHWADAYWIDLQGVNNVVLAGQQLMAGLGLTSDVPDTQQLLAWLEGRPRERFGIVITHIQEMLSAPAEEQQGFLDLLDNILHSSHKLQVVVVCDEPLPRITYLAREVEVEPLGQEAAGQMIKQAEPSVAEDVCRYVTDVCQGAPVALAVVCGLMRYGHCSAAEFMRIYSDPSLPIERTISDTSSSSYLPFESRLTNERLQRVLVAATVALPDDLVTSLLVLSLLPAPFSFKMAAPLLALPTTNNERRSMMRRLVSLGLLSFNASLQLYTMHSLVRQAARLLVHNLGLPYVETGRRFAELLVSSARHLVLPLVAKSKMLSARLAWSRISVHVVQLLNLAFQDVREDMVKTYVALAWDLMPLLSSCCGTHTLQGFCQMVVERAQFLDMNMESAQVMTVLGATLAESGALKRADTLLRQALEVFWRELKGPHPAVARCYRELGALLLKAGKAAEAATQLQACLEMQEQLFGGLSSELLPVLQLQVELLRRTRKFSEAEGVCQRALGICGAAYGPADVQVAVWKNQLAQVVRQAGRLVEAQSLAQEALALLQSQLGSEHPRVAAQLMMLGQLAAQQGKQAAAEQNYRKALQVYQTVSGLHHPDTFNCLTSLVSLLRGAGKASHALPLAQRCLAVKKKSLGELHPDTAASMQVVADVMLDLGRYAEVESNCSRAVWVYQQLNQPANSKPVIVATTMQALALVLLGRASEAEQLAMNCLTAAKQMSGSAAERSSFMASCYNCLGEVLREMGRLSEAEEAAREGLAMREKDLGSNHPIVAISLQTLGHILRMRQQLPEALEAAVRCQKLRAAQAQGPPMAAALHLQAMIYLDMGDLSNALAQGQTALSIRQKVLSSEHPDLAHSLTVVSEVLLLQDKYAEAEPLLSHAVQIFIAQLGSSHPATQRAHMLLKQATNPRSAATSMSMRLASADLGIRGPRVSSTGETSVTKKPLKTVQTEAVAPEQVHVTVPVTENTELAVAADELAGPAGDADEQHELDGPPTAQFFGVTPAIAAPKEAAAAGSVIPAAPGLLNCSPTGTGGANISIASKINNIPAAAGISGSYVGYMSLGTESPPSRPLPNISSSSVPAAIAEEEHGYDSNGSVAQGGSQSAEGTAKQLQPDTLSRTVSSMPSESAAAPQDPSEWELGRQFGQPVSLMGDSPEADAGARAYSKVLHELTRRSSINSENAKDSLLTEPSSGAIARPAADAETAADASIASVDAGDALVRPAAQPGEPQVDAAEENDLAGLDREAAAREAAAAEAELTAEEDSKLKKLHGVGVEIEDLRAFLREHGWQLSRLSTDERDPHSSMRTLQGSREASQGNHQITGSVLTPTRTPGTAAGSSDGFRRSQTARVPSAGQAEGAGSIRRPPARHHSFINSTRLVAVEESAPLSPAWSNTAAGGTGPFCPATGVSAAVVAGMASAGQQQHLVQQQQPLQYQQQQRGMPNTLQQWGNQHDGSVEGEHEAEAEELYYQQLAAAETEAAMSALQAEQDRAIAQQAQLQSRGAAMFGLQAGEVDQQLRQQYAAAGYDHYTSEDEAAMGLQGMHGMPEAADFTGWQQQQQQQHAQGQRVQRRRDSWDASYGPAHPWAQAAAAAAAQCGYELGAGNNMQAHMDLLHEHTAATPLMQWHSQGLDGSALGSGRPSMLAPLQINGAGLQAYSGALPGSGSSRGSIPSTGHHPHGGAVMAAAAAAAAALQAHRSGSTQYSPLSPAGSAIPMDGVPAGWTNARNFGPGGQLPAMPSTSGPLPKYPSNISSYSIGSGRSGAAPSQHVESADSHQSPGQQQQHNDMDEGHQQQEQQYTVAAKARAALNSSQAASQQDPQQHTSVAMAAQASSATDAGRDSVASPGASSSRSVGGSAAGTGRQHAAPKRNVSFKTSKQQAQAVVAGNAGVIEHQGEAFGPILPTESGSPRPSLRASTLRSARSASSALSRPRSPMVQAWDEQQQAQLAMQQLSEPSLYPNAAYMEPMDGEAYYGQGDLRSPGSGYPVQQLQRPLTAGAQASAMSMPLQQARVPPYTPTGLQQAAMHIRNRSFNAGQMPWADATLHNDASRAHQQLLLQQQVLQVQAARLELQQQQLEIEQLLNEQAQQQAAQQHNMQFTGHWPQGLPVATPAAVAQQQRGSAGFYPGPPVPAPHIPGMLGFGPLQPAISSASTASIPSPASPAPHQMLRGSALEQVVDSNVAGVGGLSHLAHVTSGPSPNSSMLTAGSSYVPSSPSASSSMSSRPALSRGASDNHEAQVAAAAAAQGQQSAAAAAAAASRMAQKQQQQHQGQGALARPGSPDRMHRAASGPPSGGNRQLQQQLHRLHREQHSDQQEVLHVPATQVVSTAMPHDNSHAQGQQMFPEQFQQLYQQQQQQQQQQAMHFAQQQQIPALGRMGPGRQYGYNRPYSGTLMEQGAYKAPVGVGQQLPAGYVAGPSHSVDVGGRGGATGIMPGQAPGYGSRSAHPSTMLPAVAVRGMSSVSARSAYPQGSATLQRPGPSFRGTVGAAAAGGPTHDVNAAAVWSQGRWQLQQEYGRRYAASASSTGRVGSESSGYPGDGPYPEPGSGTEDYEMWATAPDYGQMDRAAVPSSSEGPSSGASRSFIAPGGGQYWQGRRSNSFSNLTEATMPQSAGLGRPMTRSRSSEELPVVKDMAEQAGQQ